MLNLMLFKTLGLFDLIAVLLLIGEAVFPTKFLAYAGIYLILKGIFFVLISNDLASYGDAVAGGYLMLLTLGLHIPYFHTIVLLYLAQKTILTFVVISINAYVIYRLFKELRNSAIRGKYDYYSPIR